MRKLYLIGICAFFLLVVLAPEMTTPEDFFQRCGFCLTAMFIGYLVIRHRVRLRYVVRLKRAFNSTRLRAKHGAIVYRRENNLQTA